MDYLHQLHDAEGLKKLIEAGGYLLLFAIIFAETGLLIGFFLPGDSLLFMAGFVASAGYLDIRIMVPLLCVAAIVGDQTGYMIGRKAGPMLFNKPDSRFFKRAHLDKAHAFYEKHGPITIVLARFFPIVRTFAPTVAGAAGMDYKQFVVYNVAGGIGWITSMSLLGYYLGRIPVVAQNMDKATLLVAATSLLPIFIHVMKGKRGKGHGPAAPAPAPRAAPVENETVA